MTSIIDKLVEQYLDIAAGGLDEEYTAILKEGGREAAYSIIRKLLTTLAANMDEGALEASAKQCYNCDAGAYDPTWEEQITKTQEDEIRFTKLIRDNAKRISQAYLQQLSKE